jgi:hypothetical protein
MAVTAGVICFVLGVGAGAFGMFYWKFDPRMEAAVRGEQKQAEAGVEEGGGQRRPGPPEGTAKGGPPGGMRGGGQQGGMRGGGPPGGMRGGGQQGGGMRGGGPAGGTGAEAMGARPNPKLLLTGLVAALDSLTAKPVEIKLSDEQKSALVKALKDIDPEADMTDEEAGKKLETLMKVIEAHKDELEAVGYHWPTTLPPRPLSNTNPFAEDPNKEHLKQLSERVQKK